MAELGFKLGDEITPALIDQVPHAAWVIMCTAQSDGISSPAAPLEWLYAEQADADQKADELNEEVQERGHNNEYWLEYDAPSYRASEVKLGVRETIIHAAGAVVRRHCKVVQIDKP